MADFFSGVYGARFPDVVMNQGPLPGTGGLPHPLHDTVDGKINYNSSLLGDLDPYAYGEPGYLSSQNSYLNIPHRIQKIVPCLYLPDLHDNKSFTLTHPIDDGDISFTMRLDRNSEVCSGLSNRSMLRAGLGTAIDPMINLCTLNYILAGMQICTCIPAIRPKWDQLLHHLDKKVFDVPKDYNYEHIKHIVRHLIRPFGVAHGSEKQGGQHEGTMSSVQWPVSFVISLILDGKDANLVNIWNYHDVEAGNDLVLRLKAVPLPPGGKYTLNHYPKSLTEKSFTPGLLGQMQNVPNNQRISHVWQLVPDIFSLDMETPGELQAAFNGLHPNFVPETLQDPARPDLAWQQEGYWHIARAQVHSRKYGLEAYYYNDLANNLRTGHMDVTFQPVFNAVPYRNVHDQNTVPVAVPVRNARGPGAAVLPALPQQNVFNYIGFGAGDKRNRQQALRLEQGFDHQFGTRFSGESTAANSDSNDHVRQSATSLHEEYPRRVRSNGSTVRVHHDDPDDDTIGDDGPYNRSNYRPISGASTASSSSTKQLSTIHEMGRSGDAGLTEDIGTFEDPGPLMSSLTAPSSGPAPFNVAKPGLKSSAARKSASRGKGMPSSVLAADGSVTHQQASML
jgi:hypothetical protein